MPKSASRWTFLLSLFTASAGIALYAACTGSDPAFVPTGGTSSDAAAVDAALPPTYGVFVSSVTLPTDFAVEAGAADVGAYVDDLCASLAADAGVLRAERYRALITVYPSDDDSNADTNRLLRLRATDARGGRWCLLAPTSPPTPQCASGIVFDDSPLGFVTGPQAAIVTDEHGLTAPVSDGQHRFLSGYITDDAHPGDVTAGSVRNCSQWSHRLDDNDAEAHTVANGVGFGLTDRVERDAEALKWVGNFGAWCDGTYLTPLLCIEQP